jgi:hypothetical protein
MDDSQMPHNKQLQRAVERHRGDAASAPFHYAHASRGGRHRAAADLRRYAPTRPPGGTGVR